MEYVPDGRTEELGSSSLRYEQIHPEYAINSVAQVYTQLNKIDLAVTFTRKVLLGRISMLVSEINGGYLVKGIEVSEME